MVQFSNFDRIMEAGDHLKNEASSRGRTSRGNFFIVLVAIIFCFPFSRTNASEWEEKPVFISGEIINFSLGEDRTVKFSFRDLLGLNEEMVAQIDENNAFQLSFSLAYPQDFYVQYGRGNLRTLFCSPGDSLFIKIDATSSGESRFSVIGGTSKQTNDLISDFLRKIPNDSYIYNNFNVAVKSKSPLEYLEYVKEREKLYREFHDKFVSENQTTQMFRKWASDRLKYETYHDLLYYTWYHPYLNEIKESTFEIPKEYFAFLETYDMNDSEIISIKHADFLSEYARYFRLHAEENISEKMMKAYKEAGNVGAYALFIELIEKYSNGFTKDFLLAQIFSSFLEAKELELFNQLFDAEKINNNHFLKTISTEHDKLISYLNNTNTETANISILNSQSDILKELNAKYNGKFIYIDFWATWCGPCLAEFDASKKLQQEWKSRDVVFVFLANRSPENVWEATIANEKLSGEHILLTNDQYNVLSAEFNISGIPHYVLIDKAGNIVSKKAPRPSERELLIKLIDSEL